MTIDHEKIADVPRLLMEANLKPLQGERFQPTGFADLGAARYTLADGTEMLLIESAQSVANRLERACLDDSGDDLISELEGLPYLRVNRPDGSMLTNSMLEAHRINSPYILEGQDDSIIETIKQEVAGLETGPITIAKLAQFVARFDVNALLHGVFLAKKELAGGRLRLTRAVTGFIEARNIQVAESGGVKNDRVNPSGDTKSGFGNVPFHRTEFTAESIKAYFNLDLALLRGYRLGTDTTRLLIALSLFKIRRFLSTGLRLRTACDFDLVGDLMVTRPESFVVPSEQELLDECSALISKCAQTGVFADPPVTSVVWEPKSPKSKGGAEPDESGLDTVTG